METGLMLIVSLLIILAGAEAFTNSVEWLGKKLNLSEGAVGSVLAAVGTALPETMIPLIAIFFGGEKQGAEIGVGAILGAPFMLGTLALFVTGAAIAVNKSLGRRSLAVNADLGVMARDLHYFLLVFTLAVAASFLPHSIRPLLAVVLFGSYGLYVYRTFQDEGSSSDEGDALKPLYCCPKKAVPPLALVILQLALSLGLIVGGAHLFVTMIEKIAQAVNLSPMILSLVIAPIATELPEKLNSIIWVGQKKDTLALGNISGAMVFQSSIGPAIGILLTPWVIDGFSLLSAVLTIISIAVIVFDLHKNKRLSVYNLLLSGVFYLIFLGVLIYSI